MSWISNGFLLIILMSEYILQAFPRNLSRCSAVGRSGLIINKHVFQVCSADTRRRIMSPSLCQSQCRSSASQWERPLSVGRPTQSIPSLCSPPLSWLELQERRWVSVKITSLIFILHESMCQVNIVQYVLIYDVLMYVLWRAGIFASGLLFTFATVLFYCPFADTPPFLNKVDHYDLNRAESMDSIHPWDTDFGSI